MSYELFEKNYKKLTIEQQAIVYELVISLANMNNSISQNYEKKDNSLIKNLKQLKGKIKFFNNYNYKEMRNDFSSDSFYSEENISMLKRKHETTRK